MGELDEGFDLVAVLAAGAAGAACAKFALGEEGVVGEAGGVMPGLEGAVHCEERMGKGLLTEQVSRRTHARHVAAGPGPLEVEAADAAVDIADLAADVEPRAEAGFHGVEVEFGEGYASGGDFGVGEAAIAAHGELGGDEGAGEGAAGVAIDVAEW